MEESWNIKGVDSYRDFFKKIIQNNNIFNKSYELTNNLCYNFQYLEFLTLVLQNELHEVVKKQTIKTYVVIGSSIIESLSEYYLYSTSEYRLNHWELKSETKGDIVTDNKEELRTDTKTFRKLKTPVLGSMTYSSVNQKIISKKFFGENDELYSLMEELRDLRNKIHLTNIRIDRDHDWNNFNSKVYDKTTKCLRELLKSSMFSSTTEELDELFGFLKLKLPQKN